MTDLAALLDNPPEIHRHRGTCCWARLGSEKLGEDMSKVHELLDVPRRWPHKELAAALRGLGWDVATQSIYRHRADGCDCCGYRASR